MWAEEKGHRDKERYSRHAPRLYCISLNSIIPPRAFFWSPCRGLTWVTSAKEPRRVSLTVNGAECMSLYISWWPGLQSYFWQSTLISIWQEGEWFDRAVGEDNRCKFSDPRDETAQTIYFRWEAGRGTHKNWGFAVLRISITIIQINASLQNTNQTKKLICSH